MKEIEFEFEHWEHRHIFQRFEDLKKSDLYEKSSLREKLYVHYYQIYSIQNWGISLDSITKVNECFNEFHTISFETIPEPHMQLFYVGINLWIHQLKEEWEQGLQLIRGNMDLVGKITSEQLIDKEIQFMLGLFYYASSFIYVHYKALASEELALIDTCGEYWIQLHKQYYDFKRMEVKIRYFAGKDLDEEAITFAYQFIDYVTKHNFPNVVIVMPTQFLASNLYIYSSKHDLKKAMELTDQCIHLLQEPDPNIFSTFLKMKSAVYRTKGDIFYLTGDFNSALASYQEALGLYNEFSQKFGNILRKDGLFDAFGKVYNALGSYELGLKNHLEALRLRIVYSQTALAHNMASNSDFLSVSYYRLIKTYLLLNRKDQALEYFGKLETLVTSEDKTFQPGLVTRYKICQALILLKDGLFKEMSQAKDLLKEVIDNPLSFEYISDALIPLIEVIVQEYTIFHNQRSLKEFDQLRTYITQLLENNNSIFLHINFLIVQGKIAFINGDYTASKSFYEKALVKAKEFDRSELIIKIQSEMEVIEKESGHNQLTSTTVSRFNLVELESYMKEAFQVLKTGDTE